MRTRHTQLSLQMFLRVGDLFHAADIRIRERDHIFLKPAANHFEDVNLMDEAAVKRALKKADGKEE